MEPSFSNFSGSHVSFRRLFALGILFIAGSQAVGATEQRPPDPELAQALELFRLERFQASGEILERLANKAPQQGIYWFNLGNAYFKQGHFEKAISSYEKVRNLKSALQWPATLYIARALLKQNNPTQAHALLLQLQQEVQSTTSLKAEVDDTFYQAREQIFDLGLDRYESGDYVESLKFFEILQSKAPSAEVALFLGLASMHLEDKTRAERELRQVLSLSPKEETKQTAQYFLDRLSQGGSVIPKPFWLNLDISGGYDNNIYGVANKKSRIGRGMSSVGASGAYHFFKGRLLSFRPQLQLGYDEYYSASENRFLSTTGALALILNKRSFTAQIAPRGEYQVLGSDRYLSRVGAKLEFLKSFGSHEIGLSGRYMKNNGGPIYQYMDGHSTSEQIHYGYESGGFSGMLAYQHLIEKRQDLVYSIGVMPLSYYAHGPSVDLSWRVFPKWRFSFYYARQFRIYKNKETYLNIERRDTQDLYQPRVEYSILPQLRAYASATHLVNTSTLTAIAISDKNFSQTTYTLGATWDILP